jgi:hypothetical protein
MMFLTERAFGVTHDPMGRILLLFDEVFVNPLIYIIDYQTIERLLVLFPMPYSAKKETRFVAFHSDLELFNNFSVSLFV